MNVKYFKPFWEVRIGSKQEVSKILQLNLSAKMISEPLPPYLRFHTVKLEQGYSNVFFNGTNNFFTRNASAFEGVNLHFFFRTDILPESLFIANYLNLLVFPNFPRIRKFKIHPFDAINLFLAKRFQRE